MLDLHSLVDSENGWVDRRIFSCPEIFDLEMERIFARCWHFLAHESQIPNTGDYLTAMVGRDQVIVVRKDDARPAAYLNSCPHRGNRVCFPSTGNSKHFTCNYHGWSFDLNGSLTGVPSNEIFQRSPEYDQSKLGLTPMAKVASYKGLIFGTFDSDAPSLEEYLGDFCWYLDVVLDNDEGGTEFVDGCIKYEIECNWKYPADNFVGDSYHAVWTHASAAKALFGKPVRGRGLDSTYQVSANGHGWGFGLDVIGNAQASGSKEAVEYWRGREAQIRERLGSLRSKMVASSSSANIFPNFGFLPGHSVFRLWVPTGPTSIELRTWTLVNKQMPDEIKEAYRKASAFTFSPGGIFEMDDTENWESATRASQGVMTRKQKLYYGLGSTSEPGPSEMPGDVRKNMFNDSNQLAFYRRWVDFMSADSWKDIRPVRDAAE